MRLYVEFGLLHSHTGPSAAAYRQLRRAGYSPVLEYVPRGTYLHEITGHVHPPVLLTDAGEVVGSASEIGDWLTMRAGARS
jgi:hypothetical protein